MKLDITSKRIIQKIVNRQHVSKDLEEVNKAVFKKIRGKDKLDKDQIIEIAKEGFKPKFSSYKRHRKQILKLLSKVAIHKNELD